MIKGQPPPDPIPSSLGSLHFAAYSTLNFTNVLFSFTALCIFHFKISMSKSWGEPWMFGSEPNVFSFRFLKKRSPRYQGPAGPTCPWSIWHPDWNATEVHFIRDPLVFGIGQSDTLARTPLRYTLPGTYLPLVNLSPWLERHWGPLFQDPRSWHAVGQERHWDIHILQPQI